MGLGRTDERRAGSSCCGRRFANADVLRSVGGGARIQDPIRYSSTRLITSGRLRLENRGEHSCYTAVHRSSVEAAAPTPSRLPAHTNAHAVTSSLAKKSVL